MEEMLAYILSVALAYHVTDIHFSLDDDDRVITEMRVQGKIRRMKPHGEDGRFFRYLAYRANLDVSNALAPQTGQFDAVVNGTTLSLRYALVTSLHVTSGVLRILNNHAPITVERLSLDKAQIEWFRSIADHRSGLYVFSGPTGSGKTTTLYTILNEVKGKKIFTLEDPVEVYSSRYIQLQINDRQNLSYADGIKQLMRHDPDIIMIGEIRDPTAAAMAVRTALTGHLVVTSLHASSCIGAIDRLLDLGIKEYQLRDVLSGVSNQRLYATEADQRIGIYEILQRKEVLSYLETGQIPDSFIPLSKRIEQAVEAGIINFSQSKQDLIG